MELEQAMRALAAAPQDHAPLPDPALLWQRAMNRERWRQYETVTHAIRVAEAAACAVCAAAGLAALFALAPDLGAMLRLIALPLAGTASVAAAVFRALMVDR